MTIHNFGEQEWRVEDIWCSRQAVELDDNVISVFSFSIKRKTTSTSLRLEPELFATADFQLFRM
jgi:hypothetical protein